METGAVYSDFGYLASLRADAKADPNAALKDVAQQFESLFIQQMMKSMRDATIKGDLFNSNQMDTYMSMADQQLSVSLAESGGIGIARMLVEQMQTKGYVLGAESASDSNSTSVTSLTLPSRVPSPNSEASKAYANSVATELKAPREG